LHPNKDEDLTTSLCSELEASTLQYMKILADDVNSNNYVPRDFTSDQRLDGKDFRVHREGFRYEKEIRLRVRPNSTTVEVQTSSTTVEVQSSTAPLPETKPL